MARNSHLAREPHETRAGLTQEGATNQARDGIRAYTYIHILYAQPGGSEHRSPVLSDLRLNIIGRAFFRGAGAGLYYCLGELSRWNV